MKISKEKNEEKTLISDYDGTLYRFDTGRKCQNRPDSFMVSGLFFVAIFPEKFADALRKTAEILLTNSEKDCRKT